jgi:hypothetical protein
MPQIFLLNGTTTWTVPDDCVQVVVDCLGSGSGGAGGAGAGGGGGGGAWARSILTVTPRAVLNVGIGAGGATGQKGNDTWFNATSLANAVANGNTVSCAAAGAAAVTGGGGTGGLGGTAAASVGTSANNGGNGGSVSTDAGGGGGAGGPNGAGNVGANGTVGNGGIGGQGDGTSGGTGGAGGTTSGTAGNPGTEYDASHGSGGGGGGCTTGTAGAGGNYGAGGGGATTGGTAGVGANGLIVINYVSAFVNKKPARSFLNGIDDSSLWSFASAPYNRSLAASILPKTVLRPAFFAPRPSDDFIWAPTADNRNANTLVLLDVGGQPPTKRWGPLYNYDDSSGWQFSSQGRSPLQVSEAFVNIPWLWKFDYDIAESAWQGTPENYNSGILEILTGTKFFGAPGQVLTKRWDYLLDDSSAWRQPSTNNRSLLTVAATNPFKQNWAYSFANYDQPNWQQSNAVGSATFYTLLNAPTNKTVLRPPFYASRPSDDFIWQPAIERNANLIASGNTPTVSPPWKFGVDDSSTWQFKAPYNLNAAASVQFPSISTWYYSPPDDMPVWQRLPVAKNINLVASVTTLPFTYSPWRYGFDDSSNWNWTGTAAALITLPPGPKTVLRPAFYSTRPFDDDVWQLKTKAKNVNLIPVVVVEPFIYTPWQFGQDDSSYWQSGSKPRNINLTPFVPTLPFTYSPWCYGFDDSSSWQSGSKPRNINLVPVVNEPFIYIPWKFGQDDSSGWQFGPKSNTLLTPIVTAGGQPSAPLWKFQTRPFDEPFWQWLGQVNANVTNRPTVVTPPIQNWNYGSSVPADIPAWQGFYWRNGAILFPTALLITDPRFVCNPNAPNSTLPSKQGSARTFVTTPRVMGMPYGNDLSVIDPTVEKVTVTFNFDPWLGSGVTIASIVGITVANAGVSLTQDPNPQGIVFGASQIGPVPPAFPGVPAGVFGRAVLQQFAGCVANVTYLLQCTVLTSDNQELNLATHLPCAQLN